MAKTTKDREVKKKGMIGGDPLVVLFLFSPTGSDPSPMEQAASTLRTEFDFRRNIVLDRTEYKPKKSLVYKILTERNFNSIYRQLRDADISISRSDLKVLLNSDFVSEYDPFTEYYDGLPMWDGHTDYILQLANTVKTNNDELWRECLKKWLVAMVGAATKEEIVNHTVLVLSGKQGVGKTTWHLNLVPTQLKSYIYSGTVDPDSKDSIINLSECLLINLDELESLSKSKQGELKEMITKSAIKVRRPYGFQSEKFIRRASFTASVNKSQFLSDQTGSRRFLCFEAKEIDNDMPIDMDLVYSQALHLLKSGYQFWFDKAEIDKVTAHNEGYQVVRMEEELVLKHFEPSAHHDEGVPYTATEIANIITKNVKTGVSDGFVMNLGKVLAKHHFLRVKHGGVYKYRVKPLK